MLSVSALAGCRERALAEGRPRATWLGWRQLALKSRPRWRGRLSFCFLGRWSVPGRKVRQAGGSVTYNGCQGGCLMACECFVAGVGRHGCLLSGQSLEGRGML